MYLYMHTHKHIATLTYILTVIRQASQIWYLNKNMCPEMMSRKIRLLIKTTITNQQVGIQDCYSNTHTYITFIAKIICQFPNVILYCHYNSQINCIILQQGIKIRRVLSSSARLCPLLDTSLTEGYNSPSYFIIFIQPLPATFLRFRSHTDKNFFLRSIR